MLVFGSGEVGTVGREPSTSHLVEPLGCTGLSSGDCFGMSLIFARKSRHDGHVPRVSFRFDDVCLSLAYSLL